MLQVGINIPTNAPDAGDDTVLEFGRRAEAAGVHSVWTLDRLVFNNYEPLLSLAALATTTTRVKLGTCVLLAALRPPLLLAKMIATLDRMSGGRTIFGFGAGSRPDDFAGAGVPFEHRGSRLEELIAIMKRAWRGGPVTYSGKYYQIDVGPVGPQPVQQPHPPIWLGGSAESVLRRVARVADGYIATSSGGPKGFREGWQRIRQYAEQAGRDPATITPAALVHVCVDDNRERAIALAAKQRLHYYGPSRAEIPPGFLLGSPDECVREATDYFDAGVQVLILGSVTADLSYFDRLCQEVIPRLIKAAEAATPP